MGVQGANGMKEKDAVKSRRGTGDLAAAEASYCQTLLVQAQTLPCSAADFEVVRAPSDSSTD